MDNGVLIAAEGFRARWTDVQTGFVDAPRRAVEQADALVAELMQHLARTFADERGRLESQWDRATTSHRRPAHRLPVVPFVLRAAPGNLTGDEPTVSRATGGPMAEEPTARTSLDAIDLASLSDEELQRLIQLLMSERERRMGLEPGPEDPV
jgi:hypothetical protein